MDALLESRTFKIKTKKMVGVKEYNPLSGWFLSCFNIAFKTYDPQGKLIYINRKTFISWLVDLENQERINQVTRNALYNSLNPGPKRFTKKAKRLEMSEALSIFNREIKKLSQSIGGYAPNLLTIYEVMKEELDKKT